MRKKRSQQNKTAETTRLSTATAIGCIVYTVFESNLIGWKKWLKFHIMVYANDIFAAEIAAAAL